MVYSQSIFLVLRLVIVLLPQTMMIGNRLRVLSIIMSFDIVASAIIYLAPKFQKSMSTDENTIAESCNGGSRYSKYSYAQSQKSNSNKSAVDFRYRNSSLMKSIKRTFGLEESFQDNDESTTSRVMKLRRGRVSVILKNKPPTDTTSSKDSKDTLQGRK